MLISLIRYLRGYLKIRIFGVSPERFLNLCCAHHIDLWGLTPSGTTYEMYISIKGFRKLKPIIRKTKTNVRIERRFGLPFFLHKYANRKVFFFSAIGCLFALYGMSLFVWNIHIEGNYVRTDEVLLEALEAKGVRHGMRKAKLDCEQITKELRKQFDDIIWASASVKGTRLLIRVKENTDRLAKERDEKESVDLVAEKEGVVLSMITRAGVPLVKEGDTVLKGQPLVSGRVEVQNDAKEVVAYRYVRAEADIYAKTNLAYERSCPYKGKEKVYTGKKRRRFFLRFGNTEFSLGSKRHGYKHGEERSEEYRLKFGEQFYLPIRYGKTEYLEYEWKQKTYTKKEVQERLGRDFHYFREDLEEKGVEILENNVKIYEEASGAKASGTLVLKEKLGEPTPTERLKIEKKKEPEREE